MGKEYEIGPDKLTRKFSLRFCEEALFWYLGERRKMLKDKPRVVPFRPRSGPIECLVVEGETLEYEVIDPTEIPRVISIDYEDPGFRAKDALKSPLLTLALILRRNNKFFSNEEEVFRGTDGSRDVVVDRYERVILPKILEAEKKIPKIADGLNVEDILELSRKIYTGILTQRIKSLRQAA